MKVPFFIPVSFLHSHDAKKTVNMDDGRSHHARLTTFMMRKVFGDDTICDSYRLLARNSRQMN